MMFIAFSTIAQVHLYDATFTTGESALSYGVDGGVKFATKDFSTVIITQFSANRGQLIYLKKLGEKIVLGPSGGIKDNTTWLAPFFKLQLFKFINLTSWNGVFLGLPKHPGWKINHGFSYHAIDFDLDKKGLKGLTIGCSVLHYLKNKPMILPVIKYRLSLNKQDGIIFSYTENVRDEKPMFLFGYNHKF